MPTKPITPHVRLEEEQYNFEVPRKGGGRQSSSMKIAVLVILTVAIALQTVSLVTPNLAKFGNALAPLDSPLNEYETSSMADIDMGLWKFCSKAWEQGCIRWMRSSRPHHDYYGTTSGDLLFDTPGWLITAQATSITGVVVAVVVVTILILYLVIPNSGVCLFPFLISLGSLIAGTLVFISCACVAFNYKKIPKYLNDMPYESDEWTWMFMQDRYISFSLRWGYWLEIVSLVLMWVSALLITLGCRQHFDKTTTEKHQRLAIIFSKLLEKEWKKREEEKKKCRLDFFA